MKIFSISFLFIFLFSASFVEAQSNNGRFILRGTVVDAESGTPLIGATVVELDKDNRTINGTVTDADGNYALRVDAPQKNRVAVSYINYKTVAQPINNRTTINIKLGNANKKLKEFTVTGQQMVDNGTGLNIPVLNSTTATSHIDIKALENLSTPNIASALEGRMPGLNVTAASGDPGAGMQIRIRGTATINGNANPLIVLDGMPYSTSIPSDFDFGTADVRGYAQLLNIAPSDIKSITILKDAAATAVWGSQAANGVLLIKTKRGKTGKPAISYSFRGTFSKQPDHIPLLNGNQYATLIPEEVENTGGKPLDISNNKEFSFDPQDPFWYYNYSRNSDWIGAITQTGFSQDHNISMTGGGQKARYYASVGYYNSKGTTKGTNLKRITSKINFDYDVSDRIHFKSDITFTHLNNRKSYSNGIRNVAYNKMPNMSVYKYDMFGHKSPNYFSPASNIQGQYSGTYNPLALAELGIYTQKGNRITPTFKVRYDAIPSVLSATFNVQFDINNSETHTFLPQDATGRPLNESVVNNASFSDGDVFDVYTKTNFIYTPRSNNEDHILQALLSIQTDENKYVSYNSRATNTASSKLQYPFNGARVHNSASELSATKGKKRSIGALLQAQYNLFNKYIMNVGVRADGNSRFGPDNRYGLFPSASVRWRVSDEGFMQQFDFLDDFSFKASYGHAGSAPPDKTIWNYYNTYKPFSYSYMGATGTYPTNMQLSNLKWQTLIGTNFGFDIWMFDRRIEFNFDAYRNRIKDMFFDDLNIPSYTGFSKMPANVGTMDNQGWEILLRTVPVRTKNWRVDFRINMSRNTNIMRSISPFYPKTNTLTVDQNGLYKTYLQIGNPFGAFYGFRSLGVYKDKSETIVRNADGQKINGPNGKTLYMRFGYPNIDYVFQPGDAKYEDINHDGNINDQDIVYLGNGLPKVVGGFGLNVTFKKNLKLIAYFDYKLDYDIVNRADMLLTNMYGFDNQSTAVLSRWRNPGDETNMPRALHRQGYNWLGSDRYVEDASYLRFQALTLRYNFSADILSRWNIRNASFYITVENLYTWTKYKGQNPDVSIIGNNSPFSYPVDNALTPPARTVLFGLNLSF